MAHVATMLLVGGHPALDFVNTLGGLSDDPNDEYLRDYGDLVTWCVAVGLLGRGDANVLRAAAQADPDQAARVLEEAKALREALDRTLRDRLADRRPSVDHLRVLGSAYADALRHAELNLGVEGVRWTWPKPTRSDVRSPLWRIGLSVLDLLERAPLNQLGECHHCSWLFLDTSRNHTRRWCSMNGCGGVAKMRRHRAKRRRRNDAVRG